MKTLLVDDDSAILESLASMLASRGHEVLPCSNAEDALAAFLETPFPLVVLDWTLPGMDGIELCRRLRKVPDGDHSVILMITGRDAPDDLLKVLDAGADNYIAKPIDGRLLEIRLSVAEQQVASLAQRRRAEDQLRESLERLHLATTSTNDGLFDGRVTQDRWDHPDNEVWYSTRFKAMLGYEDDQFDNLLSSWLSHLHPDDHDTELQALADHIERHQPYDRIYRLRTADGGYRWFRAIGEGIWDDEGNLLRMTGSVRDVTRRVEAENAMRESEEKWRSLVENAPDIIITADPDGTIRFINRVVPDFEPQAVYGTLIYDYVPEEQHAKMRKALKKVCHEGGTAQYEVAGPAVDGSTAWYASHVGPIQRDGQVVGVTIFTRDITPRRRMEDALRSEQALLKQMIDLHERDRSVISYEIHDGLVQDITGALMHLDAYREARRHDQDRAEAELERGMKLVRDAVDEGRRLINGVRPPILDEMGIVAAVEHLVNEAKQVVSNIRFAHQTHFDRLAPPLENTIFRIAQEALNNVCRHSGARTARVDLTQMGEQVRLKIRDWGCGFNPRLVQEERFGLKGIRERTRLMGGALTLDSQPGKGTQLVVDLPLFDSSIQTDDPDAHLDERVNGEDADEE